MGTTIEECIDELEWIKLTGVYPYGNTKDKLHTDDYIDVVIDILKKYQKIEAIVNSPVYIQEDVIRYKMICEVLGAPRP